MSLTTAPAPCRHLTPSCVRNVSRDTWPSVRRLCPPPIATASGWSGRRIRLPFRPWVTVRWRTGGSHPPARTRTTGKALRAARLAAGPQGAAPTQTEFAARLGDGLGCGLRSRPPPCPTGRASERSKRSPGPGVAVSGWSADALLARARDRAAVGPSAGAAAGEVDLAGLAEQVLEQGREISALARTIARMRRRLEDAGILVAGTGEEGAGRRADAM